MPDPRVVTATGWRARLRPASPATARIAVTLAFASNGLIFGAWAPRIPEVKDALGLSSAGLGLALLAPAAGSILAIRFVGRWSARHGTAVATRRATVVCLALGWLPGVAVNLPTLWLALLAWGAGIGAMDVSMNAAGVTVEAAYRRPLLSGFHAAWSLGTFTGAVAGGLGAGLGVPIAAQQATIGAVLLGVAFVADRALLADPRPPATGDADEVGRKRRRFPPTRLVLLGIAAVFALISEGAVADWSGVLLRDHLDVSVGQAGLAFAAFSIAMTAGRLVGDRLVHRFGRRQCVATLSVIGAIGLGAGLGVDSLVSVVIGFALLGIGLSVTVPVVFSAAADGGGPSGPAIAIVASFGYTGFLIGPTLIGLLAQGVSVQAALRLLPLFTLAAGALGLLVIRPAPYEQASP